MRYRAWHWTVAVVLCFSAGGAGFAQENPPNQQGSTEENPPARVGRLSFLQGNVSFLRAGVDQWSQAALNFPVTTGDRIYTDRGARAELQTGYDTVRLSEKTDVTITNLNDQVFQVGLDQGTIRVTVQELLSGNTVEVDTPNGALTVVQPGTFRVDVDPGGDFTVLSVNSGSLEVTGGGVSQTIQSGQAVKLTGHDSVSAISVPLPRVDEFDKWCGKRDLHLSASASARYVSRGVPGYDDLDDYGHWEEVAEYGPVWYPVGVAVDWVPYRFGRWFWVGPWGWTWIEDEPWGFCQFHFGRWVHVGIGWGWLPGPFVPVPIYAPAVVAFVGGPHFSITVAGGPVSLTAWFPLGPGEPFFPWYHCREEYIRQVNITNIRNVTNITNIVNVTNVNNIHYAYRTVATTAVPANVFRSGQAVAHQVVRLTPQQLQRAQVIPHPSVNPTMRAALPGRPVTPPPARPHPVVTAAHTAPGVPHAAIQPRGPTPLPAKNPSPVANPGHAPAPGPRSTPMPTHHPATGAPPVGPPRLITRTPPPPPQVPFTAQRPFLYAHPGRPLEPQQLQNLRAGRPPGPMLDREIPPHFAPPAHIAARPAVPPPREHHR